MGKSTYSLISVLAIVLAVSFIGIPGVVTGLAADQNSVLNPDPDHIQGAKGDKTIKVRPRNDTDDYRNLQ